MMHQAPEDERRRFPRIPLLTEVWVLHDSGHRTHIKTQDLSRGGLCLETPDNALDIGDRLQLEIRLPDEARSVHASAKVMWLSPGLAGVMFVDLPSAQADCIDAACQQALESLKSFADEKTPRVC